MSEELAENIKRIHKQKGGALKPNVKTEFVVLCQEHFRYRPDVSCGKCIYKHAIKLYDKFLK